MMLQSGKHPEDTAVQLSYVIKFVGDRLAPVVRCLPASFLKGRGARCAFEGLHRFVRRVF
jgi:hypothetical protein